MEVKQAGVETTLAFLRSGWRWLFAGFAWSMFILGLVFSPQLLGPGVQWYSEGGGLVGDPGDSSNLVLSVAWLAGSFVFALIGVLWVMDRGKRIVIDKNAGIVTVEHRRWFLGGKRYTLPMAAVTAVTIDADPYPSSEDDSLTVSMAIVLQGCERVEVLKRYSEEQRARAVGASLSKLLEVSLVDNSYQRQRSKLRQN